MRAFCWAELMQIDRSEFISGAQSAKVELLNEGIVRQMYYQENMTLLEISREIGCQEVSVRRFMERNGMPRRVAAKRNQSGEFNDSWAGESVGYTAAHQRVYRARGRPKYCSHCGSTDPEKNYEWASINKNYHDINDYMRLCRSCHCKHDNLLKNLGDHANVTSNN